MKDTVGIKDQITFTLNGISITPEDNQSKNRLSPEQLKQYPPLPPLKPREVK
jgi:hypothetical protein